MDYYWFCYRWKYYFKIGGAKKPNKILFTPLFIYGLVIQQWFQQKQYHNGALPIIWSKFKNLSQKNLGDSRDL